MISVVVPVHDEERSVALLHDELAAALDPLGQPWEVVFVDDGSTDGSFAALTRLHARHERCVSSGCAGTSARPPRLQAGFEQASGDVIVTIDGDLQDDPAEIPRLLAKLDEGFDLVSGWKTKRRDPLTTADPVARLQPRHRPALRAAAARHELRAEGVSRRGRSAASASTASCTASSPCSPTSAATASRSCPVNHRPREHGRSRYGLERYLRGFLDLITVTFMGRYRHRPLHLFGGLGLLLGGIGRFCSST